MKKVHVKETGTTPKVLELHNRYDLSLYVKLTYAAVPLASVLFILTTQP